MASTRFSEFVKLCKLVESTSSRNEKIVLIASFLEKLQACEAGVAVRFLVGEIFPEYSDRSLNVGWVLFSRVLGGLRARQERLLEAEPTLLEVYSRLEKIASSSSRRRKEALLTSLLDTLSGEEVEYLARILFGEVRIGAAKGIVMEAIAKAAGCSLEEVKRAYMFLSDLGDVAEVALEKGRGGLRRVNLELFKPVKPMLAEMCYDLREALREHGGVTAFEWKYDGVRVQIHVRGGKVRIFTRRLSDVTSSLPDVVGELRSWLRADSAVLDGEVIGVVKGRPVPFQHLMRRIRRQDVRALLRKIPLKLQLFDLLYLNGRVLVDEPYSRRRELLEGVIGLGELLARRLVTGNVSEAESFLKRALEAGHEGLMAKRLDGNYEPGHRGKKWLKIKPYESIDCVIVGAEWGHGRREGWLSDYYLAVRDEETGEYLVVGKTFKGLTDEEFKLMTRRLLELTVRRERRVVWVKPSIVVEVAYNEIQRSPRYKSGLALRFARITRIRWDKKPEEATSIQELRRRFERQFRFKAELDVI